MHHNNNTTMFVENQSHKDFMSLYNICLQAEMQKLRVEMAAMKRDAEHYSRQVRELILTLVCLLFDSIFSNMFQHPLYPLFG